MIYKITVTDVDAETLRAAYEKHKEKIPPGATVCFVCENLDLSKYEENRDWFSHQQPC